MKMLEARRELHKDSEWRSPHDIFTRDHYYFISYLDSVVSIYHIAVLFISV